MKTLGIALRGCSGGQDRCTLLTVLDLGALFIVRFLKEPTENIECRFIVKQVERNLWTQLVESVKFKLKVGDLNKLASSRLLPRKTNKLWCFMLPPLYGNGSLTVWAALNSKPRLTITACETWLRKCFVTSKQHYNKNSGALRLRFFKKKWFNVKVLKLRTIHYSLL